MAQKVMNTQLFLIRIHHLPKDLEWRIIAYPIDYPTTLLVKVSETMSLL